MAYQIGKAVIADIKGKGKLRDHGEDQGPEQQAVDLGSNFWRERRNINSEANNIAQMIYSLTFLKGVSPCPPQSIPGISSNRISTIPKRL